MQHLATLPNHYQQTLADSICVQGIGIHSGESAEIHILPADPDTGIRFHVMDNWTCGTEIPAHINCAVSGHFRTSLSNNGGSIDTTEHVLAALRGCNVDNALIKIWGSEVPILDGSAIGWVNEIDKAGVKSQGILRKYLRVINEIVCESSQGSCTILPQANNAFTIEYELNYKHCLLGKQHVSVEINEHSFRSEIAPCRTFGFAKDGEYLKKHNLALGASVNNTLVFDKTSVRNEDGLRTAFEPSLHKVLDVIGDLALVGYPIIGAKFIGIQSGHKLNQDLARKLYQTVSDQPVHTE